MKIKSSVEEVVTTILQCQSYNEETLKKYNFNKSAVLPSGIEIQGKLKIGNKPQFLDKQEEIIQGKEYIISTINYPRCRKITVKFLKEMLCLSKHDLQKRFYFTMQVAGFY